MQKEAVVTSAPPAASVEEARAKDQLNVRTRESMSQNGLYTNRNSWFRSLEQKRVNAVE